jgi:hypothetical protein
VIYRQLALLCLLVLALAVLACDRSRSNGSALVEAYAPTEGSVSFAIKPATGNHARSWIAVHTSQGKTAKFRIELGPATASEAKDSKDFRMSFGAGKLESEAGSEPTVFLAELKKALEAKVLPKEVQKVPSVPFDFVVLGENQSRAPDGGFSDRPQGNWTAMKIFLAGGEGEVFLNLNPVIGKAEFSIKDSDYGDTVLRELAKVL